MPSITHQELKIIISAVENAANECAELLELHRLRSVDLGASLRDFILSRQNTCNSIVARLSAVNENDNGTIVVE